MSFSYDVKEELSKSNTFGNEHLILCEVFGYACSTNFKRTKNKYEFSTSNEYNINRYGKMLAKLGIEYKIKMRGNKFLIDFNSSKIDSSRIEAKNEEEKKAIIRGAFMGGGSVNEPNNKYHLEIILSSEELSNTICNYINEFGIEIKQMERANGYSLYIKDGENISNLLAIMGASKSVVRYEEIRVLKDKRNNINRIVNCETANLNKTINASILQIEAIKKIQKKGKFDELPESLKEIAKLRQENPEMSLVELGELLKKPIGKSGVNHRLNNLIKIANEL